MSNTKKIAMLFFLVLSSILFLTAVNAACYYDAYDTSACPPVDKNDWGVPVNQVFNRIENVADNNPGQAYMAWCPTQGGNYEVRPIKAACDCPNLKPAPGTCVQDYCNNCGNPVVKCAPPPSCVDECDSGDQKCSGDNLLVCKDTDGDGCTEWTFKKDCDFENTDVDYVCEYEDSVKYTTIEEGYCVNAPGYNDYCDSYSYEKRKEYDCGETTCESEEYCKYNDIYTTEECVEKGCTESTGMCYTKNVNDEEKVKECGNNYATPEICDGENIVKTEVYQGCTEDSGEAECFKEEVDYIIEECGPDICTPYTELDIYVKESVIDDESCEELPNGPMCMLPLNVTDMCAGDILIQPYCDGGEDHVLDYFDCSDLTGCKEFDAEICVYCDDPYGNCVKTDCNVKGQKYVEYTCGDGACQFTEFELVDTDGDKIDDIYCDDCIDVDHDGICDDVDNCVGLYNPTQVDEDRDGYGNACDDDKDGDGYASDVDCDDWNKDVNPGAEEIKNNHRDDDCNPDTLDKGSYTPRQALYVDMVYDETMIQPGKDFDVLVSVTNYNTDEMKDIKISVTMTDFQERYVEYIGDMEQDEQDSRLFRLRIPKTYFSNYGFLRVSVGNDNYKRIIYREIALP